MNEINEIDFDYYWLTICDYANSVGVSPSYVEDEFILEGEFIMVSLGEVRPR